jgi:hypothetical protein
MYRATRAIPACLILIGTVEPSLRLRNRGPQDALTFADLDDIIDVARSCAGLESLASIRSSPCVPRGHDPVAALGHVLIEANFTLALSMSHSARRAQSLTRRQSDLHGHHAKKADVLSISQNAATVPVAYAARTSS